MLLVPLIAWAGDLVPDGQKGSLGGSLAFAPALGAWSGILLASGGLVSFGDKISVIAVLAIVAAAGLVAIALADTPVEAKFAYFVFAAAGAKFLALHASQTLRVLPNPAGRGRDIGIFNLINMALSLVMPWVAISVVPGFGFVKLFLVLALLALSAAIVLATVPRNA